MSVQNATDLALNAERAYEKAAKAIGRRHYATLIFRPSLKALYIEAKNIKDTETKNAEAKTKPSVQTSAKPGIENQKSAENAPLTAFASAPLEIHSSSFEISPLQKSLHDNEQQRFASYHKELKFWNENYDLLLTDVEYSLDKPVFKHAGKETKKTSYNKLNEINCSKSLRYELNRLNLDSDSLKFWFAGINKCFREANQHLDELKKDAMLLANDYNLTLDRRIQDDLDELLSNENAFRCAALRRIDYYKAQKELSILSVNYFKRMLTDQKKKEAAEHFQKTAEGCP